MYPYPDSIGAQVLMLFLFAIGIIWAIALFIMPFNIWIMKNNTREMLKIMEEMQPLISFMVKRFKVSSDKPIEDISKNG